MRKLKGTLFEMHTSMHKHVAGRTLDYYPSDTKQFEKFKKDITYRFNNHGFRADHDIDEVTGVQYDKAQGPINAFIGCSNTMGIGVNLEETWCHHVNQRVGGIMINLGQAGGAALVFFRSQLAVLGAGGEVLHLGADLGEALAARIANDRRDQARRRGDRDRDILARILEQLVALEADIAGRHTLERAGERLDQQIVD